LGMLSLPVACQFQVSESAVDDPSAAPADSDGASDSAAGSRASEIAYVAELRGWSSSPRVETSAFGAAQLSFDPHSRTLRYRLQHNLSSATQAHIHFGAAGETGAAAYPLLCVSDASAGELTLSVQDVANLESGMFYLDVHSGGHESAEIRGQILHEGEALYVAELVPANKGPFAGADVPHNAQLIVDASKMGFHYHVSTGASLAGTTIQRGIVGTTSEQAFALPASPTLDGTLGFRPGDNEDLVQGRWFINIPSLDDQGTSLVGRLMLPGETLYSAALNERTSVVGAHASGTAQFILAANRSSIRYELALFGLSPQVARVYRNTSNSEGSESFALTLLSGYSSTPRATAGGLGLSLSAYDPAIPGAAAGPVSAVAGY